MGRKYRAQHLWPRRKRNSSFRLTAARAFVNSMGNASAKSKYHSSYKYTSQCSLGDLTQSFKTNVKSWSHSSHRSWSEGTLYDKLGSSKTLWPVSRTQSIFLPEFHIKPVSGPDEYAFINVIQKGAFGKVCKIKKKETGQFFALKVISKAKIIAENAVTQAKQEVAIQSIIGHYPFILNCCYKWQSRRKLYIMTDYVCGGELCSLVSQYGCLSEDVVRIYIAEIAIAIDFLHDAGVVHRDIKATNILLDERGHAVLIDFGFAKWLSRSERTNTICGTLQYMAPEILKRMYYGQEVDWWSLGVLCYFLLLNQYPYETSDLEKEEGGPGYTPPGLLSNEAESLSPAAKDLLKRLLQPDPRSRLCSLRALQRIAFYMGRDLLSYLVQKESPFEMLEKTVDPQPELTTDEFADFDSADEISFLNADC